MADGRGTLTGSRAMATIRWVAAILGVAGLATILSATLSPIGLRPVYGTPHLERFLAYAATAGCLAVAFPRRRWLVLGGMVAIAASLEAAQQLTETRHGHPVDALVKMAGACVGVLLGSVCEAILARIGSLGAGSSSPEDAR